MAANKQKTIKQLLEEPMLHENHPKPVTRRDFLAQGSIGMTGIAIAPSILSLLQGKVAFGAECSQAASSSNQIGFICFDLAGGANIAGSNVMVGKRGGQEDFLATYASLGLPDGMHPKNAGQVNKELGLAFHADSAMLRGMKTVLDQATMASIDGAIFCTSSADDTGNNPHNPTYWINKAGASGELTALVGTSTSVSGGTSRAPDTSINPAARPVQITSAQSALGLVDAGKLVTLLSSKDAERILRAAKNMSDAKLAQFQNKDLPTQIKELISCGYLKSSEMINKYTAEKLSPTGDPRVQAAIAGFTGSGSGVTLSATDQQQIATITKLVLDGFVGAATIQKGGFDYHTGNRATGEARSEQAGIMFGLALRMAKEFQRDLMIYVFTDGSVSSSGAIDNSAQGRGKGIWQGDSGQRSSAYTLVYKAGNQGRPALRNSNRQIGAFKDSGGVDIDVNKISSSVETLAKAITANYLALQGKEAKLKDVVGDDPFGAELEKYLAFNKIR